MDQKAALILWMEAARQAFRANRCHLVAHHFPPEGDTSPVTLILLAARIQRDLKLEPTAAPVPDGDGAP